MKSKKILTLFLLMVSFNSFAEIAIVVHPSNNASISAEDVTQLFLGKTKNFPDGSSAVPIGQEENTEVTNMFYERVMSRSSQQIKAYWSKQIFSGKGTPPKAASDNEEVLKLVASNPNLIGYVDSSKVNSDVKVVLTM